jgi:hypothetical protein
LPNGAADVKALHEAGAGRGLPGEEITVNSQVIAALVSGGAAVIVAVLGNLNH